MSRQSKAKRDARKKQQGARPIRRLGRPVQPVAQLRDEAGELVGGGGLREHEWLLLLGGQVAATTESAAMLLAMLRHVQSLAGDARVLTLEASPELLRAASLEAAGAGHTLEDYLALLEQERVARGAEDAAASMDDPAADPDNVVH